MKTQKIPVDNIKNEPKFILHNKERIIDERHYLIENFYQDDPTIQDDIDQIEKVLNEDKKLNDKNGVNMALVIKSSIDRYNGDDITDKVPKDGEHGLLESAGLEIEKYVIQNILQPKLNGTYQPNSSNNFPDWDYNGRNVDVKCVYLERCKQKYQSKFNAPKYNNALEDSTQVYQKLYNFFKKTGDEKSNDFCRSLILYCYYEIFNNFIRVLDFIVVPLVQTISVTEKDGKLKLREKCNSKNTNTCISLYYGNVDRYRVDNVLKMINEDS